MRLTEHSLRHLIRSILMEQVVGYKPPASSSDEDDDFLDMGGPISTELSSEPDEQEQGKLASSLYSSEEDRQKALDSDDVTQARQSGYALDQVQKRAG